MDHVEMVSFIYGIVRDLYCERDEVVFLDVVGTMERLRPGSYVMGPVMNNVIFDAIEKKGE